MRVRKIVAGLAALSMLAAFSAQTVLAADTVTITADNTVVAQAGEGFTMNVSLSGVPAAGISVCEFAITYDAEVVTVTGVTVGEIADNGVDSAEPIEGATAFESDYSTAGVINVTYTTGLDDTAYWITEDGVLLTITGTVNETAAEGEKSEFVLGAIQRETTEGSGVINDSICIGNIAADYTVSEYGVATSDGLVTVGGGDVTAEYGDANVDGDVTVADVILVNQAYMKTATLEDQGEINADVDIDGDVDLTDSLNILKSLIDLVELPVGQ